MFLHVYIVYILQSVKTGRFYIGSTGDVEKRLEEHNSCQVRSTKAYVPWRLAWTEVQETRTDALKRERLIKSYKGGVAFQKILFAG